MTYLTNKPRIIITIYGSIDRINFVELLDDILKHTLFQLNFYCFMKKNITIHPNLSFKTEKICNTCKKIQQHWNSSCHQNPRNLLFNRKKCSHSNLNLKSIKVRSIKELNKKESELQQSLRQIWLVILSQIFGLRKSCLVNSINNINRFAIIQT